MCRQPYRTIHSLRVRLTFISNEPALLHALTLALAGLPRCRLPSLPNKGFKNSDMVETLCLTSSG